MKTKILCNHQDVIMSTTLFVLCEHCGQAIRMSNKNNEAEKALVETKKRWSKLKNVGRN